MILAQKVTSLLERLAEHRRALALLIAIPGFGVVAAFGIAPDTMVDKVDVHEVIEQIALPQTAALNEESAPYVREERIQRGDTVAALFSRLQVDDPAALQVLRTNRDARSLYQLVPGRSVRAVTDGDGHLISLRYFNDDQLLSMDRDGTGYRIQDSLASLESRTTLKSGEIRNSLFGATDAAGIPDAVATQMADIFSGDIDFHKDLRRGDRFSVLYETFYYHGEPVKTGRVLAAEFTNDGTTYKAVYFEPFPKQGGYYTFDGKNLRKEFLRAPLEFSRITSGFTTARFHPILKIWRAHKGVDYGAPIGTRVHATADGVVEFVGQKGGYGNVVILRHETRYSTVYGHLSRFAAGLHRGERVTQGEVIAYTGMTGWATGPHLHYEFRINDVQQNPLRIAMPSAPPIGPAQRAAFEHTVHPLALQLDLLRTTNLAGLD